jgi:site-specific DNA recombinase
MAGRYRERVANLRTALTDEKRRAEAAEIMRTLIDKIELAPVLQDGRKSLSITLHGDLAGILGLAAKAKGPLGASDPMAECTKLVAGGGFEPPTFRL